jgi:hypothetical protein
MAESRPRNMTHVMFHKACVTLKKNKQEFLDKRPTQAAAAEMLGKMLGFEISSASIPDIQEATGVRWRSVKDTVNNRGTNASVRQNAVTSIARALAQLYEKLGEEMPTGFKNLIDLIRSETGGHRPTVNEQQVPTGYDAAKHLESLQENDDDDEPEPKPMTSFLGSNAQKK